MSIIVETLMGRFVINWIKYLLTLERKQSYWKAGLPIFESKQIQNHLQLSSQKDMNRAILNEYK